MRYEYRRDAAASKLFNAKQLSGLPGDIELGFDTIHVRVYKSEEQPGFFHCTLAIPAHKDAEGYVLEIDFNDPIRSRRLDNPPAEEEVPDFDSDFDFGEPSAFEYEAPLNDHSYESITQAMSCQFRDKVEQGRRILLFKLSITGTPFDGDALILPGLYEAT